MLLRDDDLLSRSIQRPGEEPSSRRVFLNRGLAIAGASSLGQRRAWAKAAERSSQPLFADYVIPPQKNNVQEAALTQPGDGVYWLLFGEEKRMVKKVSIDRGRTWSHATPLQSTDGEGIATNRNTAHQTLLRLRSGNLGLIYGGPSARKGRDGTVLYRISVDKGETWGPPVVVDPLFALCRNGSVRVLRSGRIVAPTLKWISPAAGPESESDDKQMVFSWIYYSDDEGKTWQRSLSELFISVDSGRRGFYSFDEPVLEELDDNHLLMVGRTQLGRPYKSFSEDGGISWSNPAPVNLASSDSPHTLIRVPSTSDLLIVWNQTSTEECLTGLMRHRLSTAISSDGGETWGHFKNLESLDDRTYLEPPPAEPRVYLMRDGKFIEPTDHQRYPHAPGCLRISYPTVTFSKEEVAFAYDYGYGGPGGLQNGSATKIQIVTLDWLYREQA